MRRWHRLGIIASKQTSVSDYNKMMEMQGRAPISLGEDELAIFSNLEDVKPLFDGIDMVCR